MSVFLDIELADAARAITTLVAVAEACRDPATVKELAGLIETTATERQAADAAAETARQERAAADRQLAELEVAGRHHTEWVERTTKELTQRRTDLDENVVIVAQREHIVGERERDLAERERRHAAAVAHMRSHLGDAA